MKPMQLSNGRWVMNRHEHFLQWCAWRYWLARECDRRVPLEKICVWGEWPPETMEGAQMVAQFIAGVRNSIQFHKPVCDPAQPWDRWTPEEREKLMEKHREDPYWDPRLPHFRGDPNRRLGQPT